MERGEKLREKMEVGWDPGERSERERGREVCVCVRVRAIICKYVVVCSVLQPLPFIVCVYTNGCSGSYLSVCGRGVREGKK